MHTLGWGLGGENLRLKLRLKELFTQHKCLRTSNAYSTYYVYPYVCSVHPRNLGPIRTTKTAHLATENSASSWRVCIITSLHYSSTAYPALPAYAPHPPSAPTPPKKRRARKEKQARGADVRQRHLLCLLPSPLSLFPESSPRSLKAR